LGGGSEQAAIVSSTARAMAVNLSRPERNRSTATSSAPTSTAGDGPLRSLASPATALSLLDNILIKAPEPNDYIAVAFLLGIFIFSIYGMAVAQTHDRFPAHEALEATRGLLLLRGDHEMNEVKVGKVPGLKGFRFATEAEILEHFGSKPGYLGPVGMKKPVRIVADRTVANMSDFVCGANEADYHYTGVNWSRDLPEPAAEGEIADVMVADIRNVQAGDPSPDGKGTLAIQRGIEVGHVFFLGTKYSEAMNATFVDEDGQSKPLQMGCYGIGVTRLLGAAIEQNHDEKGIIWPAAIAPFEVVVCPMGLERSESVREAVDSLAAQLETAGIRYVVDDRNERPGVMFADWELIGVPLRITVGDRGLKEGLLELTVRRGLETRKVPPADVLAEVQKLLPTL